MFSERYGNAALSPAVPDPPSPADCLSLRQEEALALTAIYAERFVQRIVDHVWTIDLQLDWLSAATNPGRIAGRLANQDKRAAASSGQVCKFYLKGGGCKFGERCRFQHQLPGGVERPAQAALGGTQAGMSSADAPLYQLEVRFPPGSCYPHQPPLVAFCTNDASLPGAGRLNLTEYLFGLSLSAAQEGELVVYTLLSTLEEEQPIRDLLSVTHHKFSSPPPVLAPPPTTVTPKSKPGRNTVTTTSTTATKATSAAVNSGRNRQQEGM